jgi:hypothetical protein
MYDQLKDAIQEYKNALRLFEYATTQNEIDVAIGLWNSSNLKIQALKKIPIECFYTTPVIKPKKYIFKGEL